MIPVHLGRDKQSGKIMMQNIESWTMKLLNNDERLLIWDIVHDFSTLLLKLLPVHGTL